MAMEIEAKYRLDDPASVRAAAKAAGAEHLGTVLETNRFFDRADGGLRQEGRGLRVRVAEPIGPHPDWRPAGAPAVTVTCKGPRQPGPLKVREEIEFTVDAADAVVAMFEAVGFVLTEVFQKRRDTWSLGPCLLAFDEVPGLGHFLEVEGPTGAAVADAADRIGMVDAPVESRTYGALLADYRRRFGLGDEPIVF